MHVRADLHLPGPLRVETVVGELDKAAGRTARRARTLAQSAVRRRLPVRSRTLYDATRGTARRTATGYRITVTPRSTPYPRGGVTAREVARFVEGGTGIAGPTGLPIYPRHAEAFPEPFGEHVRGQQPQHPFQRAAQADGPTIERVLRDGAPAAARAAEAALERSSR